MLSSSPPRAGPEYKYHLSASWQRSKENHACSCNNEVGRKVEDGTRARTNAVAPTNELGYTVLLPFMLH